MVRYRIVAFFYIEWELIMQGSGELLWIIRIEVKYVKERRVEHDVLQFAVSECLHVKSGESNKRSVVDIRAEQIAFT